MSSDFDIIPAPLAVFSAGLEPKFCNRAYEIAFGAEVLPEHSIEVSQGVGKDRVRFFDHHYTSGESHNDE